MSKLGVVTALLVCVLATIAICQGPALQAKVMDTRDLLYEFKHDEESRSQAIAKYQGKTITVRGFVCGDGIEMNGASYCLLGEGPIPDVKCYFDSVTRKLNRFQLVTVSGYYQKQGSRTVYLVGCQIK